MNPNYDYPKNEMEFYKRRYSIDDLINNYTFDELVSYYMYGLYTIKAIQELIDKNRYHLIYDNYEEVENEKSFFIIKSSIVKNALKKINACDVIVTKDRVFILNPN